MLTRAHSLGCHGCQVLLQPGLDGLQVSNPLMCLSQLVLKVGDLCLELPLLLLQLIATL